MALEYDIIIVGGGPAGLSAASSIVRQDHTTVLFDSQKYRNALSKHMHTLPTWDHQDPEAFRAAARANFERYGTVTIEKAEVRSAKRREEGNGQFEVVTDDGRTFVGKKMILATGVEDIMPDIPGYADCWVSGIFHCLYCHGWEERGVSSAGVLAEGDIGKVPSALHIARQALRMAQHVNIYTDGNEALARELHDALQDGLPAPMTVDSRKIAKLVKAAERAKVTLEFEDGTTAVTEGFLAHKPKTRLRGDLAAQLGVEMLPGNVVKVSPPFNQTSVRGVFAAGDCASPMQTISAAIHSGMCTGGGAPSQLQADMYNQRGVF
ncbi:FAD/NAD(P)-binding domain-containing protein [Xylaria sp. CBS 124048]|nr:FAD/NAD(P)-binding domain-containing protein [Xylaria sp. CBS 124048]